MSHSELCSLRNSELAVDVIPSEGGRIASLRSLHSGLEFLTQPLRSAPHPPPSLQNAFQQGFCAGIEECLPTVGPCDAQGGPVPDHGDFWQLGWHVLSASRHHLRISATGFSRPFLFTKDLTLEDNILRVQYAVENIGSAKQSFLYACHPLFAVEPGDRVLLPAEVNDLRLDYSRKKRLGTRGSLIRWPLPSTGIRLDVTEGAEAGTAEMFYTGRLAEGRCAILRGATGQVLEVAFDPRQLPYLGLWLCYGGWPDQGTGPKQYAVALEPTTSGCNSLTEAQVMGSAIDLDPGASYQWEIRFAISQP